MRILLCFPPLVPVARRHPYPSLPALAGHLRATTDHEVRCWDANADFLESLLGPCASGGGRRRLRSAYRWLRRSGAFRRVRRWANVAAGLGRRALSGEEAGDTLETHLEELLGIDIPPGRKNVSSVNLPGTRPHHLLDTWNLEPETVRTALTGDDDDAWIERVGDKGLAGLSGREPLLIGFSAAYITQVTASIALARRWRRRFPNAAILIGGACVRRFAHALPLVPEVFDVVDAFVPAEGEPVLGPVADRVAAGESWRGLPGLVTRGADGAVRHVPPTRFDPDDSALPDFSFVPDHSYEDPSCLLLRGSVGCSWNRCRFCTQAATRFRTRLIDDVVRDMTELIDLHGATRIALTDETVSLSRLAGIAEGLLDRGARVLWGANSRLAGPADDALFRKLSRAGCTSLTFGLEAGTQRVNDLMRKGVDLGRAEEIIGLCRRYGIVCGLNAIFGFPGETEDEMLETVEFLRRHAGPDVRPGCSVFALERCSYVHEHPSEFGITWIEDDREVLFRGRLDYRGPARVPVDRLLEIIDLV